MAPSDKEIEATLLATVRDVFKTDNDNLTVNFIRKRVESDLEIEDGMLSSGKWKDKSKKLIKELATSLMEGNAESDVEVKPEGDEENAKPKKSGKRQGAETSPPAKRRKRASVKVEDSEASASEEGKAEAKPKKRAASRKKKQDTPVIDSDSDEESPVKPKASEPTNGRASKVEESGSDALSSPPDSEDEKDEEKLQKEKLEAKKDDKSAENQPQASDDKKAEEPADDTTSELSDVIDEPPKPKRKKKEAGVGSKTKAKATKQKKAPAAPESPDDAEIKKLQSHLVKCGIRKIWGFELKQYGDDTKAKMRHLRGMLKDIGMDGRFSEAKAKEIKERRELEADLEAVQEMNASWGAEGRSSRSKARGQPPPKKAMKDDDSEDENDKEDDGDDDEEQESHIPSRARGKARADLAFLGDDDEESD
ncbi:transcriptional regulator [Colletotrichum orchidophilum]|uniref:Transcriptional regulator n=1 Tax=Colletotrichum orchidophilum TaxID=1209926 RepID=A0A1G4BIA7_9PEZI|nr:transcriptional regulator [Colletotrichum orchidophilum]OHF01230.1 transcriptional regulator [Colletotrichum orchidophilum]